MSEENKNLPVDEVTVEEKKPKTKTNGKKADKKPNAFVRIGKWFAKLTKDVIGEMKKVVWTSKDELKKSSKLVLVTVLAVGLAIAIVDTAFSSVINLVAGLIG